MWRAVADKASASAMRLAFRKMHGTGNDFVVVDARAGRLALSQARIAALADRHTGIGFDQLITLEPARAGGDVFMRIHNADGSEAGACGNATRCVVALLGDEVGGPKFTIETEAGQLTGLRGPRAAEGVIVDMGQPRLDWRDIPLSHHADTLRLPLPGEPAACSMGNPHATLFTDDLDAAPRMGPVLEHDPLFSERANIGFADVLAPDRIRLRVWERGAGLTRACGSGACAALVNAVRRGLAARRAELLLDGGTLTIEWRETDGHVLMTGPAATAFRGEVDLSTYPA